MRKRMDGQVTVPWLVMNVMEVFLCPSRGCFCTAVALWRARNPERFNCVTHAVLTSTPDVSATPEVPGADSSVAADVITFAGISGDTNPVHLNHEFASETMFEGQIAHGMLTASFISTVIGTKLPGPGCIYVSQNLRFKAPVKVGDTVTATCTVTRLIAEKRFIEMDTVCSVGGEVVLDGQATILVPSKVKAN